MTFEETHEPKTFEQLVFAEDTVKQRLSDYANGDRNRHLLIMGEHGMGKSTMARIIALERLGSQLQAGNIDVYTAVTLADNIKSNLLRISNGWCLQKMCGVSHPLAIVDELHLLVPMAHQYRLRSFMDGATHGSFIFTANHTGVIDAGIINRCDVVDIKPLTRDCVLASCQKILVSEGVVLSDAVVADLLDTTDWSWREILRALEDAVVHYKRKVA